MDVDAALAHLSRPVTGPFPSGPPIEEFARSPAAAAVGRLAHDSGLFLAHHEHRSFLALPDAWIAPGREADAAPPAWADGVLPEAKYQSFRHDSPIGGFHPGHRAKWATHELCHGLVGFAWRPDATPLFHATAGRLAELVPVVLWYFLDEIGLRRCPRHAEPQFRTFCPACARAAARGAAIVDPDRAIELLRDARRFVDRELAAVARTVRTGTLHPHVHGSLDLCSDGIAYAAAHGVRLGSRAFRIWAEHFPTGEAPGAADRLDALVARAEAVLAAITTGAPLAPRAGGASGHAAKDLAQRILQVVADRPSAELRAATTLVRRLAEGAPAAAVAEAYAERADRYGWVAVEDVFATGYPLDGVDTRSVAAIREGLGTVTPLVLELAADAGLDVVPDFVRADPWVRVPLGLRFAGWLAEHHPGPVADIGRFEASLRAAGGEADARVLGPEGTGLRWVEGAVRLSFAADVPTFAERVETGEVSGLAVGGRLGTTEAPGGPPVHVALARDVDGELCYVDLPDTLPAGWEDDAGLLADLAEDLLAAGVATRERHALREADPSPLDP
jgi:hypothetical protein